MFGLFAVKFLLLILLSFRVEAEGLPVSNGFVLGRVLHQASPVYKSADFDSPVLGKLPQGKVYDLFPKLFGAFYRIKVGTKFGYIADTDIELIKNPRKIKKDLNGDPSEVPSQAHSEAPSQERKKARAVIKKRRPFSQTRYLGLSYSSIFYKEDTLGAKRTEASTFFGMKLSGPDVVLEGALPTEINVQIHTGAPSYYEKLTGVSAGGSMVLIDFQFLTVSALSPVVLSWFGFGPMFRFTRFDLGLKDPNTGKAIGYNAEDMSLGAVFSLGLGFRMGSVALRPEVKYYWEKEQYLGYGAALQFEF